MRRFVADASHELRTPLTSIRGYAELYRTGADSPDHVRRSFERIEQFEGSHGSSLMAWLARIAENEIRDLADYHKRQRRDARRNVPLDAAGEPLATNVRSLSSQVVLDEEVAVLTDSLMSLMEPLLIIVLGVMVGFIVIALFMPLISLIQKLS